MNTTPSPPDHDDMITQEILALALSQDNIQRLLNMVYRLSQLKTYEELLSIVVHPAYRSGAATAYLFRVELDSAGKPEWGVMAASWTPDGAVPQTNHRYHMPDFPFTAVWYTAPDELIIVENTHTDSRIDSVVRAIFDSNQVHAFVMLPLHRDGAWLGFISITWTAPRAFTDEEHRLYRAVRTLVIPFMENRLLLTGLESVLAERTHALQQTQSQVINMQAEMLKELATPIIPLLEGIIVLPIVGSVDSARANELLRRLLAGITAYRAQIVILDVTGVPMVDSGVAAHLHKAMQAARLKGAKTIVSGISDAVAETVVDLGIDWSGVQTHRDLESGLLAAFDTLGLTLTRKIR